MNTKKKTLENTFNNLEQDYLDIWNANVEFKKGYRGYDEYKSEAIAEIQALTAEAIPEKIEIPEAITLQEAPYHVSIAKARNNVINDITTALIERGLLKGEDNDSL